MKLYLPILFFLLLQIITCQRPYVITSTPIQINLEAFQMQMNGQWVRIDIGIQGGSQPYQFFYDEYPEGWKHIQSSVYIPKNHLYFTQKFPLRIRVLDQFGNQARASIVFLISQGNIAVSPIIYPYEKKFDDNFFNEGSFRNRPNLIRSQNYYSQLYSQYSSYAQTFNPYQSFDNFQDANSFFDTGMRKQSFSSPLFQNRQINKGVINNYINYNIGSPVQTTNNQGNPILRNNNQQFRTYNNPAQPIQPIQPIQPFQPIQQTMKPIQSINLGTINIKNPNPLMINLGSVSNGAYIQPINNFNKNPQQLQLGSPNLIRNSGQQMSSIGAIQIGNSQPTINNNKGTFTILNPNSQIPTNNIFQNLLNPNSIQKVTPKNIGQFQIKTVDTGTDTTQTSSNKNNAQTDNKNIPVNIVTPNRNYNGINKALNNINGWQLVPSAEVDQNGLPSSWQLIKPGYSNCYQLVPVSQTNSNGGSFYKLLPVQSTEPEPVNIPQYYSLNQNGMIYRFQYPSEPRPVSQDDLNFPYWQIVPQKINPNGVPSAFSLVGSYQSTPLVPYLYGQPSYSVINIDSSSPKSNQSDTNSEVIIQIGRNITNTNDPNNTSPKKPQPLPNPNLNPTIRNNSTPRANATTPPSSLTNSTSENTSAQTNSTSPVNSNKNITTTPNNLTPSIPTNPTNPSNPSTSTNPTNPINATSPTNNPTSPTSPINPTNPTNPTNPNNPTSVTNSTNTTSTTNLNNPSSTSASLANSTNPITKGNITNPENAVISTNKTNTSIPNSTSTGTSIKNSTTDTSTKNNPSSPTPNQNISSVIQPPPTSPTIPVLPVTPIIIPIRDTNYSGLANNQQIDDLIVNLDSLALNKIIDDVYNFDNLTCQQKSAYLLNLLGRMQVAIKDRTYMAAMLNTQINQAKKAYDNYIFQINQTRQQQILLNTQQQKQRIEVVLKTIQGVSSQLNDEATTIPPLSTEIDNLKKNISMENSKSEIDRKQMVNQKLLYNQADIAVKNFLNQLNLANAQKSNILKTINKLNNTITDSETKIKSNTDTIFNLGNQILELSFIVDTEKYNYGNLEAEVQKYREQIARATRKQSQILPEIANLQEKLRIEKGKSATDQLDRIKDMIKQLQKSLPNLQKFVDENYYRCNNASNLSTNQNGSEIIYVVGVPDFQKYIQSSYQVQPNWSKISLPTENIRLNRVSILDPTWQGAFGNPYDSISFINSKDFSFKNDFNCLNPSTLQSGQAEIASVGNRFIMVTDSEGMIRLNLGTCTRLQSTLYLPSIGQKIYWRGSPVAGNNQYNIYRATCI